MKRALKTNGVPFLLAAVFTFLQLIFYLATKALDEPTARSIEYYLWFVGAAGALFSIALIVHGMRKATWAWWAIMGSCAICLGTSTLLVRLFVISLLGV